MGSCTGGLLGNTDERLRRYYHPVARSQDITCEPFKVKLLGQDWVVFRSDEKIRAYVDRCPHRNAPLSIGVWDDSAIQCAYHGWRFALDGNCNFIPAISPGGIIPKSAKLTQAAEIVERYGLVFLAPEPPLLALLDIPQDSDVKFCRAHLMPVDATQHAGYLADNFLDMGHFAFVHSATFGNELNAFVVPYELNVFDDGLDAVYEHTFLNREDPGVLRGERDLLQRRKMTYRYRVPFSMSLALSFVDVGNNTVIGFFILPVEEGLSRLFTVLWRDDMAADDPKMNEAIDFELKVLDEDLKIQQSYAMPGFALDPKLEVHTTADRITVAMRRVLLKNLTGSSFYLDDT